jgi:hypothetical protein
MFLLQLKMKTKTFFEVLVVGVAMLMAVALVFSLDSAHAAAVPQKQFGSPEEAVQALITAIKANDTRELLAIFGSAGKSLIFSGDEVADQTARDHFTKAFEEMNQLEKKGEDRVILHVGADDWPFPVPLVKQGNSWYFNTSEGNEEILNRRVGKNELNAIQVCLAIVDAEMEYAAEDRNGDGIREYAQKFVSDEGKRNGLYWETKDGEDLSPLGPLAAKASREGYAGKRHSGKSVPYHGYFYRILKEQGKNASDGARRYLVKGKMIGGFALVAYPAEYGNSGIMTFIVNQAGGVYQKDLGKGTAKVAKAMKAFDPDQTWHKVE